MAGNMNTLMAIHLPVVGAATFTYTVTRSLRIVDAFATSNATCVGGDTVDIQTNNGGAGAVSILTAPMAVAAANIIRYATEVIPGLADVQVLLDAGDTIAGIGSQATTDADAFLDIVPTSWISG